ncbi:MAG TPA: T9SS type A sorting domain-containing protein [Candidatus Cloacimonadota bacterium]|nr:T9SS type A sorting domain-containing protein [Candidatus Cloacimonadota bacterium]
MNRHVMLPVFLVLVLGVFSSLGATVSVSVPADYPTLTEAVSWLNSQTVSDNIVINVSAGHTESISAPITLTATGSAAYSITIQKNGVGANPLITRTDTGTISTTTVAGSGDAIIRMDGCDYVTWDGIDVRANESTIEYGYLTFKPSGTDGCQHISVLNCVVTMNKGTSNAVIGIYLSNGPVTTSSATGVTVTAESGRSKFIRISGVTVQNVVHGIYSRGSSAVGFSDSDITIGEEGAPNLIQNYGGGRSVLSNGIYCTYVANPSVSYNTIDNAGGGGTAHTNTLYGIYLSTGISGVHHIDHNSITLAVSATNAFVYYIYCGSLCTSESYVGNSFAAGTMAFTGNTYFISASSSTPDKTVSDNRIIGAINRTSGTGSIYCYYNYGTASSGLETITNNIFSNVSISGSSAFYGIYTSAGTGRDQLCANNTISNISSGSGSCFCISLLSTDAQINDNAIHDITAGGDIYGIRYGGESNVYRNRIYNFTTGTSICGIFQSGGVVNNYGNTIYDLTSTGTDQVTYGLYIGNSTACNIYNNMIYGLRAPGYNTVSTPVIRGIQIAGGDGINIHYNTIYLDHQGVSPYFAATGICLGGGTANNIRNNIVVNKCIPGSTGYSTALSSNAFSFPYYIGPNSGSNIYFADRMLDLNGSSISTLERYKTLLADREQSSFWEDVPFISTSGEIDLHIQTGVPTNVEGNALVLAGFDEDYDGQDRNAGRPDIGADEGRFMAIGALEEIVIDDDNSSLPDGVTVSSGGVAPAGLLEVDTGIPAQVFTVTATGTRNVTIMKPVGWVSDWYCWIALGNQVFEGANPIPSQTSGYTFEYVDFDAKGTAVVVINDNQTLPVELSSFTATVSSGLFVTLAWVAESETDHAGYNIYRGESAELNTALRINAQLIDNGVVNGTQISYFYSDFEAYNNMQYYYWLESASLGGTSQFYGPIAVTIGDPEDDPELPGIQLSTMLMDAYPNPFNPSTTLRYSLKEAGNVRMDVFNLRGQIIRSFESSHDSPGFYHIDWDGTDAHGQLVSSGIYMYRMTSGRYTSTKKMILAK